MPTCLRCGAALDPDDTVCFTCGAPAGETKTPTQPVPLPKAVRERTKGLPAIQSGGATAGTALSGASGEGDGSAGTSLPSLSRPLPPLSAPFTMSDSPARTSSTSARWLVTVLAVLLIAAVGVAGGIVLRASVAGPPVPRTVLYHDPAGHFQVQQPALWVARSQPNGVIFADSADVSAVTSTIQVSVTSQAAQAVGATASSQADALGTSLGLTTITSTTKDFAGHTWEQRQGPVVGSDGASREAMIEVTLAQGEVYIITCESPVTSFNGTNSLVFQPFLASFALS